MLLRHMQMPAIRDEVVVLTGGLDQRTPNLQLDPGFVRSAVNWECSVNGGYTRVAGYERFDDGFPPSSATFSTLVFNDWVSHPSTWHIEDVNSFPKSWDGALILGMTSTATAVVAYYVDSTIPEHYSGQNYLIVTKGNGVFQVGEEVRVRVYDIAGNETIPGFIVGTITSVVPPASITAKSNAVFLNIAADTMRNKIGPVPGSGPILGIVSAVFGGVRTVYAFRNTSSGTAAKLYKSQSASLISPTNGIVYGSWVEVPLYNEVRFIAGGTSPPSDGGLLVRGASTATVKRVVHESGSWQAGTASGRLIITTPTGGGLTSGPATIGPVNLTLTGPHAAITLQPNGKYQFHVTNFQGQLATARIYGADNVNRGFEFDGSVYVPIETKADVDVPRFVREHHLHLCFAIGSTLVISGPEEPYKFLPADGGDAKAVGDDITGLLGQPGNQESSALGVFTRNHAGVLYGTSALNWRFVAFADSTGAIPHMTNNLGQSYVLDDRGVMSFAAAQEFGNFAQASISPNIDLFLSSRKTIATCSCVNREHNKLRHFFSDGSALYTTIVNGRVVGHMPMQFVHSFSCVWSGENASGDEETFAGSMAGGYVFQLDRGSSFDGDPIDHNLVLAWNYMKAPRHYKRFRGGSLEVQGSFYSEFFVGYRLGYQTTQEIQPPSLPYTAGFSGTPLWDSGIAWDAFSWDGSTLSPARIDIKGTSECIQLVISGSSDYVMPFTVNSVIIPYSIEKRILR